MNRVLAKFSYGFNCTFSEKAREEEATFPELIWRSQNPLQKIPRTNSGKFQGWQFYLRRTSTKRFSIPGKFAKTARGWSITKFCQGLFSFATTTRLASDLNLELGTPFLLHPLFGKRLNVLVASKSERRTGSQRPARPAAARPKLHDCEQLFPGFSSSAFGSAVANFGDKMGETRTEWAIISSKTKLEPSNVESLELDKSWLSIEKWKVWVSKLTFLRLGSSKFAHSIFWKALGKAT